MSSLPSRHTPLLLVICTGNVCRSPMAEAAFLHYIEQKGLNATVVSRGLAAPVGRRPHAFAVEAAQQHGISIPADKRAAAVTGPELAAATAVFVMDNGHRREIQQRYPTASGKTFLLGHWEKQEIADPINLPREAFDTAWQAIDIGTQSWLTQLEESGLVSGARASDTQLA